MPRLSHYVLDKMTESSQTGTEDNPVYGHVDS